MSGKGMPRKVPKTPKKSIKDALENKNLSPMQAQYREHAKKWAKTYNEYVEAAKNHPKIEDAEEYKDFSKPIHNQTAPTIIPRGGHPDDELLAPPEETQEEEPETPKKRDKWETVRV
jgi:hypothetical protein